MTHTVTTERLAEIVRTTLQYDDNNRIPAIKIVRCITDWGLKEAKDYVDEIRLIESIKVGEIKHYHGETLKIIAVYRKWVWVETINSKYEITMVQTLSTKEWSNI